MHYAFNSNLVNSVTGQADGHIGFIPSFVNSSFGTALKFAQPTVETAKPCADQTGSWFRTGRAVNASMSDGMTLAVWFQYQGLFTKCPGCDEHVIEFFYGLVPKKFGHLVFDAFPSTPVMDVPELLVLSVSREACTGEAKNLTTYAANTAGVISSVQPSTINFCGAPYVRFNKHCWTEHPNLCYCSEDSWLDLYDVSVYVGSMSEEDVKAAYAAGPNAPIQPSPTPTQVLR